MFDVYFRKCPKLPEIDSVHWKKVQITRSLDEQSIVGRRYYQCNFCHWYIPLYYARKGPIEKKSGRKLFGGKDSFLAHTQKE
jgi:hypothetical protein